MKNLEKREVRSHNIHLYSPSNGIIKTIKCAEVRALFARNKVRFAYFWHKLILVYARNMLKAVSRTPRRHY